MSMIYISPSILSHHFTAFKALYFCTLAQGRSQLFPEVQADFNLAERSEASSHFFDQSGACSAPRREEAGVKGRQPPARSRGSAPVGSRGGAPGKFFRESIHIDSQIAI